MAVRQTNAQITRELRRRIIDGRWQPASRLPTRPELERSLGASTATIQKAIDQLVGDGFIVTNGRKGTFVNHTLPHQTRIGLAFPPLPQPQQQKSRFWQSLRTVASDLSRDDPVDIRIYEDVSPAPDCPGRRKLLDDIESDCLAGLFDLGIDPSALHESSATDHPRLKRVALVQQLRQEVPSLLMQSYAGMVAGAAAEAGCRRLGVISSTTGGNEAHADRERHRWRSAAEAMGLVAEPEWHQLVHVTAWSTARMLVRLMMRLPLTQRPDVLMIADDHLVEPVTAGLYDLNLRVPDDLQVFAHVNLPEQPATAVPVRCVGWHAADLLRVGIEMIERQLAGERVPMQVPLEPRFVTQGEGAASAGNAADVGNTGRTPLPATPLVLS